MRSKDKVYFEGEVYSAIFAGNTNAALISAGECHLSGFTVAHVDATPVYIKFYDKATAPDENDTPFYRLMIPANSVAANGSGSNVTLPEPRRCTNGLGVRVVTGIADNSTGATTASEGVFNVHYTTGA